MIDNSVPSLSSEWLGTGIVMVKVFVLICITI